MAVDGKSLRRAYEKGRAHMPPLLVTVFDCETFAGLSQVARAAAGGEAQGAIEAIKLLSLKGCVVTADALHCHRRFTKTVREAGGDYVLALGKAARFELVKRAKEPLSTPPPTRPPSMSTRTTPIAATRSGAPSSSPSPRLRGPTPSSV